MGENYCCAEKLEIPHARRFLAVGSLERGHLLHDFVRIQWVSQFKSAP